MEKKTENVSKLNEKCSILAIYIEDCEFIKKRRKKHANNNNKISHTKFSYRLRLVHMSFRSLISIMCDCESVRACDLSVRVCACVLEIITERASRCADSCINRETTQRLNSLGFFCYLLCKMISKSTKFQQSTTLSRINNEQ